VIAIRQIVGEAQRGSGVAAGSIGFPAIFIREQDPQDSGPWVVGSIVVHSRYLDRKFQLANNTSQ
jgi:hypothetical protein